MSDFRKLLVWKKAMQFVKKIYEVTEKFPDHERFGLTSQLRRAAVSIPSNIAEGCERQTAKDFASFLTNARSSAAECETQILIAAMLKYLSKAKTDELIEDVIELKKMVFTLRKAVRS